MRSHAALRLHADAKRGLHPLQPAFEKVIDRGQLCALAHRFAVDVDRLAAAGDEQWALLVQDSFGANDALLHVAAARDVVHDFQEGGFEDGAEAAGTRLVADGLIGDDLEGVVRELQFDAIHAEVALVLLDERVLRLREYLHEGGLVQRFETNDHRQAADEFGDEAEFEEVVVRDVGEELVLALIAAEGAGGTKAEADVVLREALFDVGVESLEGTAADKQDVRRVYLEEVLVRVLAAALGGHIRDAAFNDLEEGLLDTFTGDITRDARVVALACDLVDLVDVDDPALGLLDIEVGRLDEVEEDVLDVFANVAGLCEGCCIGDGERHIKDFRERLGEQGLARTGRADKQNVGFFELDIAIVGGGDAL